MGIRTPFAERFSLTYPIMLAPMGGIAGGRLAAAVSNAGGLGLVGGGYGDLEWLETELALARQGTRRPWGVGVITWHAGIEAANRALRLRAGLSFLSFRDPPP